MKQITFFELKAMYLTELYGLLAMSLETGDYVSDKMALKIEKRIVKGANKTWRKLFRKHRWNKGFYSLTQFKAKPPEETPKDKPAPVVVVTDNLQITNTQTPLLENAKT
ncbi:MAG: hypothetical protein FWC00_01490 [Firmicutes bacterium]|nr:hypothetical protein [Bacillota bacterium]